MSLTNTFDASKASPKLGSPEQFNRQPTRLRDLKAADISDLPPLYDQEEKAVQRLEAFDARLGGQTAAVSTQERAALDRDLLMQKSRARIEKLKDIQSGLSLVHERLNRDTPSSPQLLVQLRSLIQSAQSQLTGIYDGNLLMTEGFEYVRPMLVNCTEKLSCLQPGKMLDFSSLRERDASMSQSLKSPNPVPVMEKAALLALAGTVDQLCESFLALTDTQPAGEDSALLQQHQPSLQLLQRAGRSQQGMLTQLTILHSQLSEIREQMSLNLLQNSLQQLRSRSLRELLGIRELIAKHLPALSPLVPLLNTQHQRLEQTGGPEFLSRRVRYSLSPQTPATPDLPAAIQPMLDDYTVMIDKVIVAFETLSAQCLEKDTELMLKGEMADLDALFGF